MRLKIIMISLLVANCMSCAAFNKDINKICLELQIKSHGDTLYQINIKSNRKTIAVKTVSGRQIGKKVIRIDKNSFQFFINAIVLDNQFYSMPDTINCTKCLCDRTVMLTIKTKTGTKKITGNCPQKVSKEMENILFLIKNMVGYLAYDFPH